MVRSLFAILFEFLAGFPPFSGRTPEETWTNLDKWPSVLRRPEYDAPEDQVFNLTDTAWDAITRCARAVRARSRTRTQAHTHITPPAG